MHKDYEVMGNRLITYSDGAVAKYCKDVGITPEELTLKVVSATSNTYDIMEPREAARISFQKEVTRDTDIAILTKLIGESKGVSILDVGCNDGGLLRDRLRGMDGIKATLGIDVNEERIAQNIKRVAENKGSIKYSEYYEAINCEAPNFVSKLQEAMKKYDIPSFDVIVLSMVLLHLGDVKKFLANLKSVCKPGTRIYIRDMNDATVVAKPDPEGIVPKILEITSRSKYAGFRYCGGQVGEIATELGYKCAQIPETISTEGMNVLERALMFETNYGFVEGDVQRAYNDNPEEFKEGLKYIKEKLPVLEEMFGDDNFYYKMGTVVWVLVAP